VSISTRVKPHPSLPKGFDDPASFYFIPDPARAAWVEFNEVAATIGRSSLSTQRNIAAWEVATDRLNERRAADEAARPRRQGWTLGAGLVPVPETPPPSPPTVFALAEFIAGFGTPLGASSDFEDRVRARHELHLGDYADKAEHLTRVVHVKHEIAQEQKRSAAEARARKHLTCPLCAGVEGGEPITRTVAPRARVNASGMPLQPLGLPIPSITSCGKCYLVAVDLYATAIANEPDPDGVPRSQAVAKALGLSRA
jgi:hypothetical protein